MRDIHKKLSLYRPSQIEGLPLNLNTCRLSPHSLFERLPKILEKINLSNYPDHDCGLLREALARHFGMEPDWFLIGNGSDEVFDLIFKTFLNPGEIAAYPGPSYVMYPHYALANGADILEVPLGENFELISDPLIEADAKLKIICNPNNPTGNVQDSSEVERVIKSGRLVIVDEAYAEFSGGNWIRRVKDYPNLLVVRTFSKIFGLAGVRVGYVAANPNLIEMIHRVRLPFNVNTVSQALAVAALQDSGFVKRHLKLINDERPLWIDLLADRGFKVWPSQTNFLLAQVPSGYERDLFVENLARAGVLVQYSKTHPLLKSCLRISIGTADDRVQLERALDQVLSR